MEPLKPMQPISTISIDKPHQPYGQHVDLITKLTDRIGVEKMRIGPDANIISHEFVLKGGIKINL